MMSDLKKTVLGWLALRAASGDTLSTWHLKRDTPCARWCVTRLKQDSSPNKCR